MRPFATIALVALALAGIVVAFTSSRDEKVPTIRDVAVARVFPNEGDIHVRQDAIGIDLAADYTGILRLDRVEIPEDQLQHFDALNRIQWTPGLGDNAALDPGRHCATATYWLKTETAQQSRSYTWCFTAA